jgi:glycosyltransferase involved in cell wall biosynthesis
LYVEHTNADDMAYNIRKVLDNKELQQRMKVEGLVHSQKFTDENVAKNLIRVYESLK